MRKNTEFTSRNDRRAYFLFVLVRVALLSVRFFTHNRKSKYDFPRFAFSNGNTARTPRLELRRYARRRPKCQTHCWRGLGCRRAGNNAIWKTTRSWFAPTAPAIKCVTHLKLHSVRVFKLTKPQNCAIVGAHAHTHTHGYDTQTHSRVRRIAHTYRNTHTLARNFI